MTRVVPCHYNDTNNDSGVPQVDTSHDNVQMAEPPPHEYVTSKTADWPGALTTAIGPPR